MKKCRNKECQNEFNPVTSIQKYCYDCTISKAKNKVKVKTEKEWKEKKKILKKKLKKYTEKINDAKKPFQKYCRIRDKNLPCISCGATYSNPHWHGGHYKKAEVYRGVIFDEINCNKQCVQCNYYKDGNEANYRIGLVIKYGEEAVIKLEERAEQTMRRKWSDEELIEIAERYKGLCCGG
jgi:hypothetical protein